jgi:hypothetical protein
VTMPAHRTGMVTKEPITRESPKQAVKTVARGNAGMFRRTCGELLVCFYFTHEATGAASTRHSLRPLLLRV